MSWAESRIIQLLIACSFVIPIRSASLVPARVLFQNVDYLENAVKNFTKTNTSRDKGSPSRDTACDLDSSFYCSDVKDYPANEIETLVQDVLLQRAYIVGSEMILSHAYRQRSNFHVDEEKICDTDEEAIFPRMMKNRRDTPTFIVQSDHFRQMIVVEKCVKPNGKCSEKIFVPSFYGTYCKQIFSLKTLIAYDPKTNKHYEETFEFPTCCQCAIRRIL